MAAQTDIVWATTRNAAIKAKKFVPAKSGTPSIHPHTIFKKIGGFPMKILLFSRAT